MTLMDQPGSPGLHLFLHHAPGGESGCPQPDAARDEGPLGVEGDAVLVDGDAGTVQRLFGVLACDPQGTRGRRAGGGCPCPPATSLKPRRDFQLVGEASGVGNDDLAPGTP